MANLVQELLIKIGIKADTAQGQQAASVVEKIGGAATTTGVGLNVVSREAKATASELGRGVEVGNAASAMVQNLAESTKGGATGFLSLARGAFGAGVALKGMLVSMGPFGAICAGVGIALGLITAALRKNEEAVAETQRSLEDLNKQKLDKAVEEQGRLRDAASEAMKRIDAERTSLERIADAELARNKSAVDAAVALDKISKDEGERRKRSLERQREDEKRSATLGTEEAKALKLDEIATEAERRTAAAASAMKAGTAALDALKKAKEIAEAAPTEFLPEYSKENVALENAKKTASPYDQSTMDRLKAEAESSKKLSDDLRKQAAEERQAADRERETQRQEDPFRTDSRKNEDVITVAESPEAKARREEERRKQIEAMQRTPESTWRERAAGGWKVDSDVFKAAFPQSKPLPEPRADPQPITDGLNRAASAAEKSPDPKPAADAAARLAAATEENVQVQGQAFVAIHGALSAAASIAQDQAAVLTNQSQAIAVLQSRFATLSAQMESMRHRSAT